MRCFQPPADTRFYAGVDLHARALFLCVLDRDGQVAFGRNLPANPDAFLKAVAPFRDGLLVACECMHCWYWLADTCRDHRIAFVLGHAWAMKAVHGSKTKCDRHDALPSPACCAAATSRWPTPTPRRGGACVKGAYFWPRGGVPMMESGHIPARPPPPRTCLPRQRLRMSTTST